MSTFEPSAFERTAFAAESVGVTFARSYTSTSNTSTYTTTSFTPAAGDLLVVFALATATTAAGGCTGSAGLTFTQITHAHKAAGADTLYAYVADQLTTAVAQTVTITTTGDAATGCAIAVFRISGQSAVGLSAIKQSKARDNGTAGTTPSVTLNSAVQSTHAILGFVANAANPATLSPPTGWTEAADIGYGSPTAGAEAAWIVSGATGQTVTWASSSATAWGAIVVEMGTGSPAGLATATGTAIQPGIWARPMSILPGSATGTAYNASVQTEAAPISWGNWSETWSNPVGVATYAYPGLAEGDGVAHQPTNFARVEAASATGAAGAGAVNLQPNASTATASGAAGTAIANVKPNAGLATATGALVNPTVAIGFGAKLVDAGLASAVGAAYVPGRSSSVGAGLASATGAAYNPATAYAQPGLATATGAAYQPSASVAPSAGHAAAAGSVGATSTHLAPHAGSAAAVGLGNAPVSPNVVGAGHAAATGTAYQVKSGATGGRPPRLGAAGPPPRARARGPLPRITANTETPEIEV